MTNVDREYLELRRQECLARAEASPNAAIARVHREFAEEYGRRLNAAAPETMRIGSSF